MQCKKCGKCCSNFLPLSNQEVLYLQKIVRKRNLKPTKRLLEVESYFVCPFLDSKNRCVIYEDRPDICSSYTCEKFYKKDFSGIKENINYRLVDLRKEVFKEKN